MNSPTGPAPQQRPQIADRLRELSDVVRPADAGLVVLVGLVALVGVLAAFAVRFFEKAVDLLFHGGFSRLPELLIQKQLPGWLAFLLVPGFFGLAVAALKALVPRQDRFHAVPLVMLAMVKRHGQIGLLTTVLKTFSSIITLGVGGSLGREGPVVLMGGGLGAAVGTAVRAGSEWRSILVAAGSGAAIATAFHAPIAGALFVLEIVLIQFSAKSFALVGLASVTAAQVSGLLKGAPPFPIPAYGMNSAYEIPLYLILGLAVTLVARAYIWILNFSEEFSRRFMGLPDWVKPSLGGLLFGAVAIGLPGTLGQGYEPISQALVGKLTIGVMLTLLAAKFLTIGLTNGAGWVGGVFGPALFLGSMAGGAYGLLAARFFPEVVAQPGAYAVVGMAAMISGATHAPLTAMILIFEVTRDYNIVLPTMLACGMSAVFSQRFSPYSIDTIHLSDEGILLPWQVQDLRGIRVGEAMTREVHTVVDRMRLRDVITVMRRYGHDGYPVLDGEGQLVGMVTLGDIRQAPLEGRLEKPVESVMTVDLAILTPDQTLADAAALMASRGVGRLPVVDAADRRRLVGIVSRSNILNGIALKGASAQGGFPVSNSVCHSAGTKTIN